MSFQEDLADFINIKNSAITFNEIKKAYISLVKKYHPDKAPKDFQAQYNGYMILINKVFAQGKTKIKEINDVNISEQKETNIKEYTFTDFYGKEKKYKDYLEYLLHYGISEYNSSLLVLEIAGYKQNENKVVSSYDPNENTYIYDAMQHLYNATKCFSYIIRNHKDYIFAPYAKEELEKVNALAKSV